MKLKTVQNQKNAGAALARVRLFSVFRLISDLRPLISILLVSAFFILPSAFLFAQSPAWWYSRGAVDSNRPANDYAFITLGQLKWIATNACAEMNAYFGAGAGVTAVVGAFSNSSNYYYANLGQLKYVAQPFYDRLYALNLTNTFPANMPGHYPWGNAPAADHAFATIGQAKYVFSFDSAKDSDSDGLSDWREAKLGTNPYKPDTDGDGLSDGYEVEHGLSPTNPDTDGDGYSDGMEVQWGTDPASASSVPSCSISGNLSYTGYQIGTIHVNLATHADGNGIIQSQTLSQPGVFTFNNVPALKTYWIKAWRDSNGNSSKEFWEAQGDSAANPIYLAGNVANANVTLSDPDTNGNGLPDWWDVQPHSFAPPVDANNSRPYDTSMFFPIPHPIQTDHDYVYTFGLFRYSGQDGIDYRNACEDYFVNHLGDHYKTIFIEVDMLYNDWTEDNQQSTLDPAKLNLDEVNEFSLLMHGLDQSDWTVFVVLLNGPGDWDDMRNYLDYAAANYEDYVNHGNSIPADTTNPILWHAKRVIDWFRSEGLTNNVHFVLGCETPGGPFPRAWANALIHPIRYYLSINAPSMHIGTHQQSYGPNRVPEWAEFSAYEFSWNPWNGDENLGQIVGEARTVAHDSTVPFHFLEYNVKVNRDIAKEEARRLHDVCPYFDGRYCNPSYGYCLGISGPTQ